MIKQSFTHEQKHLKFKIFGLLYYPLQYFIVRLIVLGSALEPTLLDFYNGFNVSSILSVVYDFLGHLDEVLTAEHYLFIILNIVPYLIKLIFQSRYIIVFVFALVQFINFIQYQISIFTYKPNTKNVVTIKIGQPGSGKSSSGGYDAVSVANKMWQELQYKYWEYKSLIGEWIKNNNYEKILEWYEIRDSYEYYMTNDCVPCLWSNIPLCVNGQYTSVLNFENASQNKRIPYYSVLFFDEVGSIFTVAMSKDKPMTVSDFFRLCRHFGDYKIFATEQDPENIFIDVRRVVASNIYMLSQTWTNKPLLLNLIYSLLKLFALKFDKGNKILAKSLRFMRTAISYVGARKYKYVEQQNTELQAYKERERIKTYYLPTNLNYQYNDRTYKNLYLCKDKKIETEIFNTLTLPDTTENRQKYLKSK